VSPRWRIQPPYGVHRSIELRTAPRASIGPASPRRSIVGVALGWMKCVQTVLKPSGSGRRSTSATFAPRWA
jgi:hypothetical protein